MDVGLAVGAGVGEGIDSSVRSIPSEVSSPPFPQAIIVAARTVPVMIPITVIKRNCSEFMAQ